MKKLRLWVFLAACLLVVGACTKPSPVTKGDVTPSALSPIPYPRAAWRTVPFQELDRVLLWVSHAVIAYDEASPGATALRTGHWSPDPVPVARRTKAEALRLANK